MITKDEIEKIYLVLPNGIIYSKRTNRQLSGKVDRYGYKTVCLSLDCGIKHVTIHRVVAICYLDNPSNLPTVNHKDGNKLNNRVTNLEWATVQQNTQHAYDNGLAKAWNKGKTGIYSDDVIATNKFNQPNRKGIKLLDENEVCGVYQSLRQLCKEMNFDRRTAQRVLKQEQSYNTIKGYKLVYA